MGWEFQSAPRLKKSFPRPPFPRSGAESRSNPGNISADAARKMDGRVAGCAICRRVRALHNSIRPRLPAKAVAKFSSLARWRRDALIFFGRNSPLRPLPALPTRKFGRKIFISEPFAGKTPRRNATPEFLMNLKKL